jgi:NTP pyrophosphatase (non-canonical NTP hydrolase)
MIPETQTRPIISTGLKQYQQQAKEFAVYPRGDNQTPVMYPVLGLVGEAGEIANKAKKIIRDQNGVLTPESRVDLLDELGDVLWYAAMLAADLDSDLEWVANHNLYKLIDRKARNAFQGKGDQR